MRLIGVAVVIVIAVVILFLACSPEAPQVVATTAPTASPAGTPATLEPTPTALPTPTVTAPPAIAPTPTEASVRPVEATPAPEPSPTPFPALDGALRAFLDAHGGAACPEVVDHRQGLPPSICSALIALYLEGLAGG